MAISSITWNLINQAFVGMVTAGMAYKCAQLQFKKTATHAFLCTLGFVCLCAEGMMARHSANLLTRGLPADTKTNVHFWLQLIGGVLGIVGTLQKSVAKERHFHTWHGKFGIAACGFFVINCLSGIMALYLPAYRLFFAPAVNDFIHNFLGLVTFVTAMVAQYLGYSTGFFMRNFKEHEHFYKCLTIAITILTTWGSYTIFARRFL